MSQISDEERLARAALTYVAEPGDPVMGALLRTCAPAEIVADLIQDRAPVSCAAPDGGDGPGEDGGKPGTDSGGLGGHGGELGERGLPGLGRAQRRWAARLGEALT